MSALETVATWGAAHVAAAVVDAGGTVDRFGELEDRFALSSVTKLLTSYAVLVGREEHTVALDDPAGPAGSTVAHLLAHASGLAPNDPARVLVAPGTRRIYSSAGFEVLAGHLEVATGISFADYLAEAVLAPLGMGQAELRGLGGGGGDGNTRRLRRLRRRVAAPEARHRRDTGAGDPGRLPRTRRGAAGFRASRPL